MKFLKNLELYIFLRYLNVYALNLENIIFFFKIFRFTVEKQILKSNIYLKSINIKIIAKNFLPIIKS